MRTLSFKELSRLPTYEERYDYLRQNAKVAEETFGGHRWLNQQYYNSPEWRRARDQIIIRDDGCDLGLKDYPINGTIYIHHINPITITDVRNRSPSLFDPDNLVCVSFMTHQAIHYGDKSLLQTNDIVTRKPNDTKLW